MSVDSRSRCWTEILPVLANIDSGNYYEDTCDQSEGLCTYGDQTSALQCYVT